MRNTSLDEVSSLTELWLGQGRQSDRGVRRVLSYAGSWPGPPGRAGQSRLQHGTTHHHYRSTTRHHHQGVHHLTHLTPPPRAVRRICQDWTNFTSYLGHTSHQPTAHILIDKTLNRHSAGALQMTNINVRGILLHCIALWLLAVSSLYGEKYGSLARPC